MARRDDREVVLSRRRALMLAAAATGLTTGCPAGAPPQPCLSVAWARSCEDLVAVFSGATTALDAAALERIDTLATVMKEQGVFGTLASHLFDDASQSPDLSLARIEAVKAALIERGVEPDRIGAPRDARPIRITAENWHALTGNGNPLPLSGMVTIDC